MKEAPRKGDTMKDTKLMHGKMSIGLYEIACVMLICFAATALSTSAQARNSASSRMRLDIPFAFTVGARTFPAGSYSFDRLLNSAGEVDILVVECRDRRVYHSIATRIVQAVDSQPHANLIFNRYGDRYFLAQVWSAGTSSGLQIQTSGQEIDLRMNQAGEEVELSVPEQATVASSTGARK
jgi:hypothetical protein